MKQVIKRYEKLSASIIITYIDITFEPEEVKRQKQH